MRIVQALDQARRAGVTRLDAQLLLARRLGRDRTWLLAHDDESLSETARQEFAHDVARRARGEPLAYIVGEREFHGLKLKVTPAVLVPRPETELLVDWALEILAGMQLGKPTAEVVDLGTGSGAIALAVKHHRPGVRMVAVDQSEDALQVARDNARDLSLDLECLRSDWWTALRGRRFDLALANPPYIAAGDAHLDALTDEPLAALSPGGDGFQALQAIVDGAAPHLRPGAFLLVEHGFDQGDAVRAMLEAGGFCMVSTRDDLAGLPRCSGGTMPV